MRAVDAWSIRRELNTDPECKAARSERFYQYELYEKLRSSDLLAKLVEGPATLPDITILYPVWQRWLLAKGSQLRRDQLLRLLVHNLEWYLTPGTKPRPFGLLAAAIPGPWLSILLLLPVVSCVLAFLAGLMFQSWTAGIVWLVSLLLAGPALLMQHYFRAHQRKMGLHVEILLQHIDELLIRDEV